jgi:hypothetical protein
MTDQWTIPDGIEPVRGARAWEIAASADGLRLGALFWDYRWPVGDAEAECLNHPDRVTTEDGQVYELRGPLPFASGEIAFLPDSTEPQVIISIEHMLGCSQVVQRECACGFWALADPADARTAASNAALQVNVFGVVELWGRVAQGTKGWRGQYARPVALVDPDPTALVRRVAEIYDIPVLSDWPELTPLPKEKPWTSERSKRSRSSSPSSSRSQRKNRSRRRWRTFWAILAVSAVLAAVGNGVTGHHALMVLNICAALGDAFMWWIHDVCDDAPIF